MEISHHEKILRMFDADGVWQGDPKRAFLFQGTIIYIDAYAEEHGFVLPDAGE